MFAPWLLLALAPTRSCLPFEDARPELVAVAPVVAPAPAAVKIAPPRPAPAPVAQRERAHYRIDYGVLEVGALDVASSRAEPGATSVRATGRGEGGVLGLGHMENRIATEFDLARLDSRQWVDARTGGDHDLSDHATQPISGQIEFERQLVDDTGAIRGVPATSSATLGAPLLDPLGFLLRVRIEPPASGAAPQVLYVLDGQALWRITIVGVGRATLTTGAAPVSAFRYEAEAEPILYDGQPDLAERSHRSFKLWLSDDEARVPLRLEMPVGIADVVVSLTSLERV
jgi:Protein of unknown function (DUF3108)